MNNNSLNEALRQFEAAESNLVKASKTLADIEAAIPTGIAFGGNPKYEEDCRTFYNLLASLPKIDGWKPEIILLGLDEIAQSRLDAQDIGEIECIVSVERLIEEPATTLREYRYRFNQKRRQLIRDALMKLIDKIDANLRELSLKLKPENERGQSVDDPTFDELIENIAQVNTLLGSSVAKPDRWSDLHRHMHFRMHGDLHDIIEHDWPSVKAGLRKSLYGEREPVPLDIEDLGDLVANKPSGPVASKLQWAKLDEDSFERLIFALISSVESYENPEWLMRTNAPDKGRDLSVYRVHTDSLAGTTRQRVIIQCKHWLTKSVGAAEVAILREQMKMWEPPRVDVHTIATSGRFTADAVSIIERHNQSDCALKIEMWPESHLERLLASRPSIIADFSLR